MLLDRVERYYAMWAPEESVWSPWVKPVLFTRMGHLPDQLAKAEAVASPQGWDWVPRPQERVALVIDLPGAGSVWMGAVLASRGYRPVPLFNGVPGAGPGRDELVDVRPTLEALASYGDDVAAEKLPEDAPPAFLLDADRLAPAKRTPMPGQFDNRWVVFPQDFPSGRMLQHHGVRQVLLVRMSDSRCMDDLSHVMLRWQKAGLSINGVSLENSGRVVPLKLRKPWGFGWAWQRALVMMGMRRNSTGGFGAVIPIPSQSSSGWG